MPVDMQQLGEIRRIKQEIRIARDQQKARNEEFVGVLADMPEQREVERLALDLKNARAKLAGAVKDDQEASMLRTQLDEGGQHLADLKEILSHHIAHYKETTGSDVIPDEGTEKVLPIILKATTGKPVFEEIYRQESLPLDAPQFTGDVEVTGPAGEVIHRSPEAQARYERNVAAGAKHGLSETEVRIATSEPETMGEALQNAQDLINDRKPKKRPKESGIEDLETRKWPAKNKSQRSRGAL